MLHAFFNFLLLWHEILEPLLLCHANVEILLTILVYGQSEAALQAPQEPIGRGLQLAAVSRAQRRYAKGLKVQQKVQQSQHERAFVAFLQIAADSAAQAAEAPQVKQGQEQGAEEEGAAEAHPVQEEEVKQEEEDCSDVEEIKAELLCSSDAEDWRSLSLHVVDNEAAQLEGKGETCFT